MKVVFDVNVIIDVWGRSENFALSFQALDVAIFKGYQPYITSSMAPSIVYLLAARKYLTVKEARVAFGTIMQFLNVLDVTDADCRCAQKSVMDDFEDALIASAAERHGVDFIVTRNKRDFDKSPVPALTPEEFVNLYKPTCLDYDLVEI